MVKRLIPLAPVLLLLAGTALGGGAVGVPGPITLPPIVARFDEHCLDRVDRKDEKRAARQARECRKPRGSRNTLPTTGQAAPPPK